MYVDVNSTTQPKFYQGDILDDFPFFVLAPEYNLLEASDPAGLFKIRKTAKLDVSAKEFLGVVPIRLHMVILLSQTCDIQNNNLIAVAPVYSLVEVKDSGWLSEKNVELIRKRRGAMKDWFYLPGKNGAIAESFVDFQKIHYFPKELLIGEYLEKRVVALSDRGRHLLGWALSDYFARPIEDKYRE